MLKDVGDIIWYFLTGAFTLSTTLLLGFVKYLVKDKDDKMAAMERNVNQILINTSVIPTMQADIKKNSDDIHKLQLEVVGLKRDTKDNKA